MADFNPEIDFAAHFKEAGIADDPVAENGSGEPSGEQTAQPANTEGSVDPAKEAGSKDAKPEGDTGSKPTGKDSPSGGPNGGAKQDQGQGKQGQSADPAKAGPRDLTLPDGQVIKGGQERRFYESLQVTKQQLQARESDLTRVTQERDQLNTRIQAFESATQQLGGLPPEQATNAVRLYKDLAANPVGTVTNLLAELKARGHSFEGIGGAVDTAAIQAMLRSQGQGSVQDQAPSQAEVEANSSREVGAFFGRYPDAVQHEEVLAQVQLAHPGDSLQDVYFKLRQAVIDRGLDWSQPLGPQLNPSQQPNNPVNPQQEKQAPRVQGGLGNAAPIVEEKINLETVGGDTWDDVISGAMKDAGYQTRR